MINLIKKPFVNLIKKDLLTKSELEKYSVLLTKGGK